MQKLCEHCNKGTKFSRKKAKILKVHSFFVITYTNFPLILCKFAQNIELITPFNHRNHGTSIRNSANGNHQLDANL